MAPKKDPGAKTKAGKAPDKKKELRFESVLLYIPNKKQRQEADVNMFQDMHWITLTKHPSFPTPPARLLRDRKLEDHDRIREYVIPYFNGGTRTDLKCHIFAIIEKGNRKKINYTYSK